MKLHAKSFKTPALAVAAVALCLAAGSAPAAAQSDRCADLYNRVMALYQADPYSPEYSRVSGYYSSRCLAGGPSASVAYPDPYQTAYPSYQQPVAVYPGPAIVGGVYYGNDYRDGDRRFR